MLGPRPRPPLAPFGSASDPVWATSDDFAAFDRNADALLTPTVNRWQVRDLASKALDGGQDWPDRRTGLDAYDPEAATFLLAAQREGQSPGSQARSASEAARAAAADAKRKEMFEQWDKDPQKEIDAGRFLREKIFGAKVGKGNILQDPISMYDPEFSKAMREALKRATPDEIDVMNSMRPKTIIDAMRIAAPGGRIPLTPQQRRQFVTMVERAGPDGQKIGNSARQYWGMESPP